MHRRARYLRGTHGILLSLRTLSVCKQGALLDPVVRITAQVACTCPSVIALRWSSFEVSPNIPIELGRARNWWKLIYVLCFNHRSRVKKDARCAARYGLHGCQNFVSDSTSSLVALSNHRIKVTA
jgi:hypothetical protein